MENVVWHLYLKEFFPKKMIKMAAIGHKKRIWLYPVLESDLKITIYFCIRILQKQYKRNTHSN